MKIGIVEDEAIWRDTIQAAIEKYCREKKIAYHTAYNKVFAELNCYD